MASLPNERVLIVDDDDSSISVLRSILAALPVDVVVSNGKRAKHELQQGGFAAILLDADSPEIDAADILGSLHTTQALVPTPVVLLSSSPERTQPCTSAVSAIVDVVLKPPEAKLLQAKLGLHLALLQKTAELQRVSAELVISREASQALETRAAFSEQLLDVQAGSQSLDAVLQTALPLLGDAAFLVLLRRNDLEKWQVGAILSEPPSVDLYDWRFEVVAADVVRTGQPLLVLDGAIDSPASPEDPVGVSLLRELGVGSCICLPLVAEKQVLGAVMFVKAGAGTRHSTRDVELAEELAQRLASTLQRARHCTEVARDRAALQASGRTQDAFLSTFSHEIRAPLNAILGWAHILAAGEVDGGKRLHALETIERNARSLAALVADLLDHNNSPWQASTPLPRKTPTGFPDLLSGLYALVVEDDPDSSELVETILRGFGADVTCVATVRAALGALAERRPDVLVSDIGLPDDDGLTLIRRVRGMQELTALPAIALSAYASRRDIAQALAAGFHAYVAKPIEPNQLGKIIADVVNG